jgi:hypothetical protein
VTEAVDRAFQAGEPTFTADVAVPDEQTREALAACDELDRLLGDLRRWAQESDADVLSFPDDVRAYYAAFIVQARAQLQAGATQGAGLPGGASGSS